ncbi:MAG: hypothetical protein DRP09_22085 [Candidatus Thorarchaeota archaeon]|nr:MAG: hypothetical protein DRP09_22085 [Candidatus Thorarchaeota archaeon]
MFTEKDLQRDLPLIEGLNKFLVFIFDLNYTRKSVGVTVKVCSPAYTFSNHFSVEDGHVLCKTIKRLDELSILVQYNYDTVRLLSAALKVKDKLERPHHISKIKFLMSEYIHRYDYFTKRKTTLRPRKKRSYERLIKKEVKSESK